MNGSLVGQTNSFDWDGVSDMAGFFDEIKLFSRSLNQSEIQVEMNNQMFF